MMTYNHILNVDSENAKGEGKNTSLFIHNKWPPAKLGLVPTATSPNLAIPSVFHLDDRISSDIDDTNRVMEDRQRNVLPSNLVGRWCFSSRGAICCPPQRRHSQISYRKIAYTYTYTGSTV